MGTNVRFKLRPYLAQARLTLLAGGSNTYQFELPRDPREEPPWMDKVGLNWEQVSRSLWLYRLHLNSTETDQSILVARIVGFDGDFGEFFFVW